MPERKPSPKLEERVDQAAVVTAGDLAENHVNLEHVGRPDRRLLHLSRCAFRRRRRSAGSWHKRHANNDP